MQSREMEHQEERLDDGRYQQSFFDEPSISTGSTGLTGPTLYVPLADFTARRATANNRGKAPRSRRGR